MKDETLGLTVRHGGAENLSDSLSGTWRTRICVGRYVRLVRMQFHEPNETVFRQPPIYIISIGTPFRWSHTMATVPVVGLSVYLLAHCTSTTTTFTT